MIRLTNADCGCPPCGGGGTGSCTQWTFRNIDFSQGAEDRVDEPSLSSCRAEPTWQPGRDLQIAGEILLPICAPSVVTLTPFVPEMPLEGTLSTSLAAKQARVVYNLRVRNGSWPMDVIGGFQHRYLPVAIWHAGCGNYPFCESYPCGNTIVTVTLEQAIESLPCSPGTDHRFLSRWSLRVALGCND